jgi:DNA-binding LacI/PurR family transcriptional regulator
MSIFASVERLAISAYVCRRLGRTIPRVIKIIGFPAWKRVVLDPPSHRHLTRKESGRSR